MAAIFTRSQNRRMKMLGKSGRPCKELRALVSRLSDLEQQRNTVQHSLWIRQSSDPSEVTRLKITAKRKHGLSHAKEVMASEPLERLAQELNVAVSDLSTFMVTFLQ